MSELRCRVCGREIKIISFGHGWVGVCCKDVVYSGKELPEDVKQADVRGAVCETGM